MGWCPPAPLDHPARIGRLCRYPEYLVALRERAARLTDRRSWLSDLPVGVFLDDLAIPERIEVAAAHLDALAFGRRAADGPLRHARVARHEMRISQILDVRKAGKSRSQSLPNGGEA